MKIKKILAITLILITCVYTSVAHATFSIDKAGIYSKGNCPYLLRNRETGGLIIVAKAFYKNNGKEYPAYCLNVELSGVGAVEGYDVTVDEVVTNPLVWRVIKNGYPYQSLETLGVASEEEAFTATKQAVYCVLYNNDKNDFYKYEPVGEAGKRTLNAMKQIVYKARNSNETKPSNNINIESTSKWEIDNKDKNYISKKFKITADANAESYNISINNNKEKQIKITDLNGKEISKTNNKEFKIMIPIRILEKDDKFEITVKANLKTYPILYGKSNNAKLQDYALTGEIFEMGEGKLTVNYEKNTSELKIIKKDETGKNSLKGVEFRILDSNNKTVYSNLKTNEKGEIIIKGILPGKYYLEEVNTIDGYKKLEDKIEFDTTLNEQLKITIKNQKKEIEKEREEKETQKVYSEKINKLPEKLPVTGM
jgi:TQXA domain-containing protein